MTYLKSTLAVLCIASLASLPASAISIRSLLGLDDEESSEETTVEEKKTTGDTARPSASNNWGKASAAGVGELDLELIKHLLANLDQAQREKLLADDSAFKKFVEQESANISVIAAARANNLEQDANTMFLMQRGAENVLREVYLNKLIAEKLPEDFPTEAQIKEYYEKNQDNFVIPERVHVWQVFFPVTDGMDEKAVNALRKQANTIAEDIRKNKISFNDAAVNYSKHTQSSANGGYMGLIKSADLKPDIKKVIMEIAEGKTSQALTTDTGIHIVRRGAIVPERRISLDEGKTQIRQLLVNQVRAQLRKAVFEQAAKTYPVELGENRIEEWRLRLRTNLDAPAR